MKTFTKTLTWMMMAMLAFTFVSCDDDDEIARTLEGTWRGNMYVYADWGNYSVNASYTEVCFLKDPYRYSSGTGYWVDYYDDYYWGGTNRVASHIEWKVDLGRIHIYFVEDDDYVDIYNYSLNDDRFRGYISWRDGSRNEFELYHVSSPNWGSYSHWGYGYYDNYYYSKPASMQDDPDLVDSDKAPAVSDNKSHKPRRVFRFN